MKTFLLLGRNGDLICLLPLLHRHRQLTGETPRFLVGSQFAPLLEGVSYVEPVIWPYDWRDATLAWQLAHGDEANGEIANCTVYARDYCCPRTAYNFQREAWIRAGADVPWGSLPLVVDRRDAAREAALIDQLELDGRPLVLCFFSGTSAPFTDGVRLLPLLRQKCPFFQFVDLSAVRAQRLYDLLGLMEKARAMVCTDSAPLHLAAAVPSLPVVALIPNHPPPKGEWCRADWTPQQILRLLHSEALAKVDRIAQALLTCDDPTERPRIVHLYTQPAQQSENDARRRAVAQQSWKEEAQRTGRWVEVPYLESDMRRDAREIGEPIPLPFVREIIDHGIRYCRPQDVLLLTNSDVGVTPGITGWMLDAVQQHGSAFTHRWDFFDPIARPLLNEVQCGAGKWYPGSDVWAFTADWWTRNGPQYPDMIVGGEGWDMVLRQLIKLSGGVQVERCNWHEKHASRWEQQCNVNTPANLWDRRLGTEWIRARGLPWHDWQQPPAAPGRRLRPPIRVAH